MTALHFPQQNIRFLGVDEAKVLAFLSTQGLRVFDATKKYAVFPGFCDVHVHFREPGFSYKETIASGSAAAAAGGYTCVCTMPNLDPVPEDRETLQRQLDRIRETACIRVIPYGAISRGEQGKELAAFDEMAPMVCGFSDDGHGVQSDALMLKAMKQAKILGKPIVAHCEVNSLLHGGYIHDGSYARSHGHKGISSKSEYTQLQRDLQLVRESGCTYHVCHISTKESVALIREAKAEGLDVSCETAPHYLLLCDEDLQEDGRFKMNPPLRSREDREALLTGLLDGTIDMIATDHAPHSVEEKSRGLEKSAMGVVGLETAFPVLYTGLVKPGILPLDQLVALMCTAPRTRFQLPTGSDFCVFELSEAYPIDPAMFHSLGRATPFAGDQVYGRCVLTVMDGRVVYQREDQG